MKKQKIHQSTLFKTSSISIIILILSFHFVIAKTSQWNIADGEAFVSELGTKSDSIPLDSSITYGKLENGFTYYIKRNTEPEKRVVMYLAMKVGSILETEEELGLAHFLEHMNFNGTTHFPKNELVDYLQKTGVRFGADLNAYTSFDETVYQLPIPSDDPEIVDNGLLIMRDWAQNALLEEEEIDKERGVILEEKRLRSGVSERMQREYLPKIFNGSRYAYRLPIGTEEVLVNFTPDVIRQFHKKWYRPDLQALVVVGDIDEKEIAQKVKDLFADLKVPDDPKERKDYKIDLSGENQVITVTDPEMPATVVQIFMKQDGRKLKTREDFRRIVIRDLYNRMTSSRFSELMQQSDPPFLGAGIQMDEFLGGLDAHVAYVQAKPGEVERGFKILMSEVERIDQFGFTQSELSRAIDSYKTSYNTYLEEKDKRNSRDFVGEYVRHFLNEEAVPGIEQEYNLAMEMVKDITIEEINLKAKEWIKEVDRDVLILAPEKEKDNLPDEEMISEWLAEVKNSSIKPYKDKISDEPLLDTAALSTKGMITSVREIPEVGVTEISLSNGVKVITKPTDFKNDEILFHAYSPGGHSLYSDEKYQSASSASSIIDNSGVGPFDNTELQKYLSGKRVNVSPYISERTEGFHGSSSKQDLETMFQLIYQYFYAPNKDEEVFKNLLARQKGYLSNRGDNPDEVFRDTVSAVLGNHHLRRMPLTVEDLQKRDLEEAYTIYKDRFADASDFTFLMVGNIDTAKLYPYLRKYMATLPAKGRKEKAKDLDIHIPEGKLTKEVYKGMEDKSIVQLVYSGSYKYSAENNLRLEALVEILKIRLIERLREEEGGVYSPRVWFNYDKFPENRYSLTIWFGCDPENVDMLINASRDEMEIIIENGPEDVNLQKFIAEKKRVTETQLKDNGFWISYLDQKYQYEEDPKGILSYEKSLEALTPKELKKSAKEYFDDENYIELILYPEKYKVESSDIR